MTPYSNSQFGARGMGKRTEMKRVATSVCASRNFPVHFECHRFRFTLCNLRPAGLIAIPVVGRRGSMTKIDLACFNTTRLGSPGRPLGSPPMPWAQHTRPEEARGARMAIRARWPSNTLRRPPGAEPAGEFRHP